MAQAKELGVDLVGPDGLLNQQTKNVLETALDAEISDIWAMPSTIGGTDRRVFLCLDIGQGVSERSYVILVAVRRETIRPMMVTTRQSTTGFAG